MCITLSFCYNERMFNNLLSPTVLYNITVIIVIEYTMSVFLSTYSIHVFLPLFFLLILFSIL